MYVHEINRKKVFGLADRQMVINLFDIKMNLTNVSPFLIP